jgi:3-oxoacyl-[acyl-carrier protein] reductase
MNVVITGSSRGIGRVLAQAFARAGHKVLLNARKKSAEAQEAAEEIKSLGGGGNFFAADVAQPAQARDLIAYAAERLGSVDVLVNNAGIARDRTILKMSDEEWKSVIDTNLSGTFYCLRAAAELMARKKSGHILNIASMSANKGPAGAANYAASKAGVIAMSKSAARELGRFNVRVNVLLPGFHATALSQDYWEKKQDAIMAEHVLEKLGDLDELGRFAVFIAEQKSITGQTFNFDSRIVS